MENKKAKTNLKSLIIVTVLAILVVVAIVVAVISSKGNDVPAGSNGDIDNTESSTVNDDTDNTTKTPESTKSPEQTGTPEQTGDETADTTKKEEDTTTPPADQKFYNPLTGIECSEELSKMRPAAIMINNISTALPQEGVSKADIVYECLAEGGITRLMMLSQDYKSLGQVGSIRSARDYYLDLAVNHDAIYFHSGGSPKAYSEIPARKIDNCDGSVLTGSTPQTFFRDAWRLQNYAYEHTLVITGQGIANAINIRKYRTELNESFNNPMNFAEEKITLSGSDAKCVYLPFSYLYAPYLKYDNTTNTYKRWQFNKPHADKDGTQLEFDNIIVLFCAHTGPLDKSGHIDVTTTGTGDGYYVTGGKYISIKYYKANVNAPMELKNADGTPLEINKGKTYIAIFNTANKGSVNMNYNK